MERLDQGHLHPKLEVPRLTSNQTRASLVGGEHSIKELFKQRVDSYSEHLHTVRARDITSIIYPGSEEDLSKHSGCGPYPDPYRIWIRHLGELRKENRFRHFEEERYGM
jgi:hypothetical protein